jgi:hypothetical protein
VASKYVKQLGRIVVICKSEDKPSLAMTDTLVPLAHCLIAGLTIAPRRTVEMRPQGPRAPHQRRRQLAQHAYHATLGIHDPLRRDLGLDCQFSLRKQFSLT